ncbi:MULTISPECIES: class I mannose-6-phosphate isomerase [unclassified Sphingopyxis]|uniref:class I mannose-6-phosphate isomerase n=1 Tax=unclassified Sphingopyxis TaxID=2614943 RepID=UPI002857FA6F|nr:MULTISPECIES: class I mannose-6-phosphate isomerase [unclassified Sphingopyxis]MDR7058826.1 mannose-6-phosphate isomerase [Sphingopyxis sp. BE235]MDR7178988.1 mannose-6-phosphate isomerase [Sphingopyxis sp. BE249]
MPAKLLATHRVEKPWGRHQLWGPFRDSPAGGEPVGEIWFQAPGDSTPDLLIKYLFTSEKLSVQVHPNDEQAHARGLPRGKDECWLILGAAPDSTIALGTKAPVDAAVLREAALDGSIEQLLDWKPVKAGDFFYVPSGTVHAIGAGLTLIEVQQNSETTYRLYDYGRPRELHLEDGIAVSDPQPYAAHPSPGRIADDRNILVDGPKFVLERLAGGARTIDLPDSVTAWLIPVTGKGVVDGVAFAAGECLALTGSVQIDAEAGADLLLAYPGAEKFA